MRNIFISTIFSAIALSFCAHADAAASALRSGKASIEAAQGADGRFGLIFKLDGAEIPTADAENPVLLEVDGEKVAAKYDSCRLDETELVCAASVKTKNGSEFAVSDTYAAKGSGIFELRRKIEIAKAAKGDESFNSLFGLRADNPNGKIAEGEYFVPGVWYKGNFTPEGNIPRHIPQADDSDFFYREDRITLPLVMFRNPKTGITFSIVRKNSDPQTVVADSNGETVNENYLYGSLGVKNENGTAYAAFIFPGSEKNTRNGRGPRSHPVKKGLTQQYDLEISLGKTPNYAAALKKTWEHAFELYNPPIYRVSLGETYEGLIETLLEYYVPSAAMGGIRDAPGFPFEVSLETFKPKGIDYQMGFVGMQVATGYYLHRAGIEKRDADMRAKGKSVLDFWAENSLTELGYPRSWYDPGLNGDRGRFRRGSNLRTCAEGMLSLLEAWCNAKKNGIDEPAWIDACKKFGDWLVNNQNEDGSYYFEYDHDTIENGRHPAVIPNKFLTPCAVRYLAELAIAINGKKYGNAALKAGKFCLKNIHDKYAYAAGVVDNPQTIDSESGVIALNAFLSLYDLTREKRWLKAAEQAATYAETWVYSFEIPVEKDRAGETSFPKDKSIVGQHLIAAGHSAVDFGFAWASFPLYRLYIETGDTHYLHTARLAAHNTKQSMNWDGELFPGKPRGLQMEAFSITIPRRSNGVMSALNWNYAAHLDPMIRFKDAFGTPDLEEIERMPPEERKRLNKIYSKTQAADFGQKSPAKNKSLKNKE